MTVQSEGTSVIRNFRITESDGNGRTARLLLNFELMKNGYLPIIIKKEERARYYDVLDLVHTTTNYEPFIELVSELVVESEKLWLSILD